MMFLLVFDVFDQRRLFPHGMGERAITFLPMVELREHFVFLDPFGAAGLDGLDQIRQANRRMQRSQNVNVVFNPVETEHMAFVIFNDAPDVTEQILAARFVQHTLAMFRRKDDVINDLCVGGQCCSTPSGSVIFIIANRRLHLRLSMFRPSRALKFHTAIGALMAGCGS